MHKVRFPLQTPLGELTALPRPLAVFKGSTSKGRAGEEGREEKWEGNAREEEGKGGEEPGPNILA